MAQLSSLKFWQRIQDFLNNVYGKMWDVSSTIIGFAYFSYICAVKTRQYIAGINCRWFYWLTAVGLYLQVRR